MLEVVYYFYHHLNPNFPKNEICKAIHKKDFKTFKKYYDEWSKKDILYLPSTAFVTAAGNYEHSVYASILDEFNFNQITHCEYECG